MAKGEEIDKLEQQYLIKRRDGMQQIGKILSVISIEDISQFDLIRPNFDEYAMVLAKLVALRSTCKSRPTGAVITRDNIVLSTGYNGAPRGDLDCLTLGKCYRRAHNLGEGKEDKYSPCLSIHAEQNAINFAGGVNAKGSTLYSTLHPCENCAKQIVANEIKRVVYETAYKSGNKERDAEWAKILSSHKIEVSSILLPQEKLLKVLEMIINETSPRRLAPTD